MYPYEKHLTSTDLNENISLSPLFFTYHWTVVTYIKYLVCNVYLHRHNVFVISVMTAAAVQTGRAMITKGLHSARDFGKHLYDVTTLREWRWIKYYICKMQSDYATYTYKNGDFHRRGYPLSTKTKYISLRCATAKISATKLHNIYRLLLLLLPVLWSGWRTIQL